MDFAHSTTLHLDDRTQITTYNAISTDVLQNKIQKCCVMSSFCLEQNEIIPGITNITYETYFMVWSGDLRFVV